MNEKEPAGNPKQEQGFVPVPILTPETFARKQPESPNESPEESPTPPEKDHPQKKSSKGKLALIVSCCGVLLAGIVMLAICMASGAFAKEKAPAGEPSLSELSETETAASGTSSQTTAATSATSAASAATTEPTAELVTSLDQVTDEQLEKLKEAAQECIREEGNPYTRETMPDEVSIDEMNYLGMMLCDTTVDPAKKKTILLDLVYQIQVTDNTEEPPVKRQYFWAVGFSEVYQDGTLNSTDRASVSDALYFENWSARGYLSLGTLTNSIMNNYIVLGSDVDASRLLPFEGEDPTEIKVERVSRIDQITKAIERGLRDVVEFWMKENILADIKDGFKYEGAEYLGLAVTAGPRDNMVYVVYEIREMDLNTTPPQEKTFIWYSGIEEVYTGGQVASYVVYASSYFMSMDSQIEGEINSIEELREHLQRNHPTWSYEDRIDDTGD